MNQSIQWVLILPSFMMIFLAGLQAGLTWHATHVTQQAAHAAAEKMVISGEMGTAKQTALNVVHSADLQNVDIQIQQTQTSVTVEISGKAQSICPEAFCPTQVHAYATFPKESAK